ncbi:MAG TPA: bifunctional ornithine acetyltransferase/N-acetylglutamate synthase, partial [Pirellulales bacterium]
GIIGEFMPMEKIAAGIKTCAEKLAADEDSLVAAARGMMTTDTTHKLSGRRVKIGSREFQITGMCKGAAMIAPNMGTMLGLVLTDAPIAAADLQTLLSAVVDDTFNCISVDGHMSTNDTVLVLANGAAGGVKLAGGELSQFQTALHEVCADLAKQIPADGEGATHLISIEVHGCKTVEAARQIAKTVADSALVKTAVAGADPNWGRMVSAAGYAGVPFDPAGVDLKLNGFELYRAGAPLKFDGDQVSASIKANRDTSIVLTFREGNASVRFWTTDLTAEYVRLNADYHT